MHSQNKIYVKLMKRYCSETQTSKYKVHAIFMLHFVEYHELTQEVVC